MSFGWWTILDTHGKLLRVINPAALQFLMLVLGGIPGYKGNSHGMVFQYRQNNLFEVFEYL
jgi:hypothetical protein